MILGHNFMNRFIIIIAFLVSFLLSISPANSLPVISNVQGRVLSCDSITNNLLYIWTIEAKFDLTGDSSVKYRIWPGLRMLEPERLLENEGFYFNYKVVSGDTSVYPGTGYKIIFTAEDTCGYDSVRVKITLWDREDWPPLPNLNFFERHHGPNLDIRNAPVRSESMNFLSFLQEHSEPASSNFGFGGGGTSGGLRVMGNHPKNKLVSCIPNCDRTDSGGSVPWPSTAFGDPFNPNSFSGCEGDCHLYMIDVENWKSYEFAYAHYLGPGLQDWEGSPAFYDLTWTKYNYMDWALAAPFTAFKGYRYRSNTNGANVSGMSYTTFFFKADEIADGEIHHAIGFNFWVSAKIFVFPAARSGGGSNEAYDTCKYAPPIGLRLRLKPTYDIISKTRMYGRDSTTARIFLRCLQKYGTVAAQVAGNNHTFHLMRDELPGRPYDDAVYQDDFLARLGLNLVKDFEVVDWMWQIKQYEQYPQ